MSEQSFNRRRFLGTATAAAAGAALPGVSRAAARHRRRTRTVDCAIVGAGFAGLTAGFELARHGKSVVILEARNRVGGRALNHEIGGGDISEAGATFVGPTQNRILNLANDFGMNKFRTYDKGENVYIDSNGNRSTYSDKGPLGTAPPDPVVLPDITQVVTRLDQMSTEVPVDAPWESSHPEWDGETLAHWVRHNSVTHQFRQLVPVATRPIFGAEPRELSLLFVLFYIAASGNERNPGTFERNFNTRRGAQMWRFHGGTQLLCERIARRLGGRVALGSPVHRIAQDHRGARVEAGGVTINAKRVIVATPPALAKRIDYHPALPTEHDRLLQRLPQGTLIKVAAIYRRPFWRDKGLTGGAVSYRGPANVTFDDSPPDGSKGVIFGFVGGDEARKFRRLSKHERRRQVLENFELYFGHRARHPREYLETNWTAAQWTRGCPVAIAAPGTYTTYGHVLRRPVGRIHWAGTETSTYWNGYMDGAVRSGERAAREVLDRL